jgi:hypothetical protein
MSATNAVVEQKMEPIAKRQNPQQLLVTGQYLYDQFMNPSEEQLSRMNIIRDLVAKGADPLQIKGATDEMVKVAKAKDEAAGVPEKVRGPKQATAMNVRTIFQTVYGALKFAPASLAQQGFTGETGWLEARVMAKEALNQAGKVWNGHAVPTKAQKEQAALQRANKGLTEAMLEATKQTPPSLNEDYSSWQKRIADKAQVMLDKAKEEKITDEAQKLFEYALKKYDRAVIGAAMVLWHNHFQEENAGESEISEEEANALLAQAENDGGIEVSEAAHVEA